jgi:HK97 family phage major capsid protein
MSGKTDKLVLTGFQNITRHVDPRTGRYDIRAALGEDAAAGGGNTVPTDFLNQLYQHLIETAAIRQTNVRILPTSNGRSIQLPKTSSHGTAVWVGEGTAITGDDPSFGQLTLDAWKVAQLVRVSNELLEDTGVDLTGYIAEDLGRGIGQAEGERFVVGSGTNTPRGVMVAVANDAGTAVQVASATVESDNLIDLMYAVGRPYRARGFWFMADSTEKAIMKVKNADDQYVWRPGLQADVPATILGRPVVVDPFASAIGSANESIAFGDFGGFVIREDGNPEVKRSSERYFDTDQEAWRVTHRVDSDLLDANAIAVLDTD